MDYYDSLSRRINTLLRRRPSSFPFISGDTFRSFANMVYENGKLHIRKLKADVNKVIFCQTHDLNDFAEFVLPEIREPFTLITHNSDVNLSEDFHRLLESDLLKHWFAQNSLIRSKKMTTLPIGLENAWMRRNGAVSDFLTLSKDESAIKLPKILYGFNVSTNKSERNKALEVLKASSLADYRLLPPRDYRRTLKNYMFLASPAGNGIDCHRTWEAMYLGVVPIVTGGEFYGQFKDFPGLVLSEWEEILDYSQNDLIEIYINKRVALKKYRQVWADYWFKKIKDPKS